MGLALRTSCEYLKGRLSKFSKFAGISFIEVDRFTVCHNLKSVRIAQEICPHIGLENPGGRKANEEFPSSSICTSVESMFRFMCML